MRIRSGNRPRGTWARHARMYLLEEKRRWKEQLVRGGAGMTLHGLETTGVGVSRGVVCKGHQQPYQAKEWMDEGTTGYRGAHASQQGLAARWRHAR